MVRVLGDGPVRQIVDENILVYECSAHVEKIGIRRSFSPSGTRPLAFRAGVEKKASDFKQLKECPSALIGPQQVGRASKGFAMPGARSGKTGGFRFRNSNIASNFNQS
jgi:hypothetical protein